jgi:hypothetical protein
MKLKQLGATSALVLGLAICGAAAAHGSSGPSATNNGTDGSAEATNVSIPGLNHNSVLSNNNNSNQGNDYSQQNGNSFASGNTKDSNNTKLHDSQNDNSNQYNDYSNNSAQDNSVNITARVNVTSQELSAEVSYVSFNDGDYFVGKDDRSIHTGNLSYSGGAFQGWSGIQTANNNTGVAANNLATTSVSANANVNFGGSNAGSQ